MFSPEGTKMEFFIQINSRRSNNFVSGMFIISVIINKILTYSNE